MSDIVCRIYVACLASYNNGVLYGRWIDVDGDALDLGREINAMLKGSRFPNVTRRDWECRCGHEWTATVRHSLTSPNVSGEATEWCPVCCDKPLCGSPSYPSAEEWAIHDHEGFPSTMGENPDLDKLCAYARLCDEHGEAFEDYITEILGWDYFDPETVEDGFTDAYNGEHGTERKFAEHCVDNGIFGDIPERLANYIDYDAIARDLFCGDYVLSDNGHVFRRC